MTSSTERAWWPRAALRRDEDFDQERRVTWLELFFDLVFVVVLARLAHGLVVHVSATTLINFVIQFAAVFWAWNAFVYYVERFESGGLENRLFVFTAMAAMAALAVWAQDGLTTHYAGFAAAYVGTRLVNMVQWIRAWIHVPTFGPIASRFVAGFIVATVLVAAASSLDDANRRIVFAAAVLVDVVTPAFTLRQQARLPLLSTSKFPERFGLLTMIVLGESVADVVQSVAGRNESGTLELTTVVIGALGLTVVIGLWWNYFDFIARRPPKPRIGAALAWVYLHLATLAAITLTGAAIGAVITDHDEVRLAPAIRHLLAGSAGATLIGLALLETTLHRRDGEPTDAKISPLIKATVGVVIGGLGWLDLGWRAIPLLAVTVVGLGVPAAYGVAVWFSPSNTHRIASPAGSDD